MRFEIGELNILCTSLERSLAFYRDVIGFEVIGEDHGAMRLRCGERLILLLPFAEREGDPSPYCERAGFSVDLMVDDLPAAVRHLKHHGVRFEKEYTPEDRSIFIRDPEGLVFEVIQKK